MGLLRFVAIGFFALSVVYICLSLYSRSVRKDKLERWWLEDNEGKDLKTYVADGLLEYDRSFRPKLILGVYIVPTLVVGIIIYLTNFA